MTANPRHGFSLGSNALDGGWAEISLVIPVITKPLRYNNSYNLRYNQGALELGSGSIALKIQVRKHKVCTQKHAYDSSSRAVHTLKFTVFRPLG